MSQFHPLTIREVRAETADAISVAFAVPPELRDTFRYVQGQHLILRAVVDGEELRRPYSICSSVADDELRVAIKRVAGGRFSNFANDRLQAGQTSLEVPAPLRQVFRPSVQPYLISLFQQDPAAAFARLPMPALIVQGRNDVQVGVIDAERLKAAKPDAQLVLIDGMNHMLRISPKAMSQQRDSYLNPELPLARELGEQIVTFIQHLPSA